MADGSVVHASNLGRKEQEFMLADFVVLVVCGLLALGALGVIVWEGIAGRLLSMDGLDLTLISLTFLVIFGGNLAWSIHSGEAQTLLRNLQKKSAEDTSSDQRPPAAA